MGHGQDLESTTQQGSDHCQTVPAASRFLVHRDPQRRGSVLPLTGFFAPPKTGRAEGPVSER